MVGCVSGVGRVWRGGLLGGARIIVGANFIVWSVVFRVSMFEDAAVRVWRDRLGRSYGKASKVFLRFWREGLSDGLAGLSPSELVALQEDAKGRDMYRILSCAQSWVNGQRLRGGTKRLYLSHIRSFFLHNMAELPGDRSFSFRSDVPAVNGDMNCECFNRILLNCNKRDRAVFLMMAQGIMGEGEVVYVSNFQARHVLKCLSKGGIFKVALPGRKKNRNVKNFYTMLSCTGDWADAMRAYLKSLKRVPSDCLFRNQLGNPLTEQNIQYVFHWRAVKAGVIKQCTPACPLCGGDMVRERDEGRKIVYVCRECGECLGAAESSRLKHMSSVRYGVNPHEIRDLMRSRWHLSGADALVAEFMMQHEIDENGYNKFMKYEPSYPIVEYRKALPWLNVLSKDPNRVDRSEVQSDLEAQRGETELLKRELARVQKEAREREDKLLERFERIERLSEKWRKEMQE